MIVGAMSQVADSEKFVNKLTLTDKISTTIGTPWHDLWAA